MSEPITVTVRELREASEVMFLWLERNVGDQIALDVDLFWWIDPKQMYNPYRAPDDLALGSVADSIQYLQEIVEAEQPIPDGLAWLSQVIHAVRDSVVPR